MDHMRGSRKFCQRGCNSDVFRAERIQIPLKVGHHCPASETPFLNGNGPTLNAGSGLVLQRKFSPYIFVIFQGWGGVGGGGGGWGGWTP